MSPPCRPNNWRIAWPGYTATMKLAADSDPHDFHADLLGALALDHGAVLAALHISYRQHHAALSCCEPPGNRRSWPGRSEDRGSRAGEFTAGAQLHFHVEPCIESRSANSHTINSEPVFGAG